MRTIKILTFMIVAFTSICSADNVEKLCPSDKYCFGQKLELFGLEALDVSRTQLPRNFYFLDKPIINDLGKTQCITIAVTHDSKTKVNGIFSLCDTGKNHKDPLLDFFNTNFTEFKIGTRVRSRCATGKQPAYFSDSVNYEIFYGRGFRGFIIPDKLKASFPQTNIGIYVFKESAIENRGMR